MTDQPTAPQTWDTLPDDPADIPFPIVVGRTLRKSGSADWLVALSVPEGLTAWTNSHGTPDWWMPWPTFAPDPMTVNQWHDMPLLPDAHPEPVWIEFEDGHVERWWKTLREDDADCGRKRWRSEAAMLSHVGGTTEAEAREEGS